MQSPVHLRGFFGGGEPEGVLELELEELDFVFGFLGLRCFLFGATSATTGAITGARTSTTSSFSSCKDTALACRLSLLKTAVPVKMDSTAL
jgi:hypothetical protein